MESSEGLDHDSRTWPSVTAVLMKLGAAGSGCLTWAVVSVHGPFQGLAAFSPSV